MPRIGQLRHLNRRIAAANTDIFQRERFFNENHSPRINCDSWAPRQVHELSGDRPVCSASAAIRSPSSCSATMRSKRVVPGGSYHVILRGNHRGALFFDAAGRDTLEALFAAPCALTIPTADPRRLVK
jgi:hypothetical protein